MYKVKVIDGDDGWSARWRKPKASAGYFSVTFLG